MNQYLQRLVTRTDAGADTILPIVRSTSPIAEEDQRIGVLGFGGLTFGNATPVETSMDELVVPTGDVRPPSPPAIPSAPEASASTVQRKMAGPMRPLPASTNIGRAAAARVRTDSGRTPGGFPVQAAKQQALRPESPAPAPRASPTAILAGRVEPPTAMPADLVKPRTSAPVNPVSDPEPAAVSLSRPSEITPQLTISARRRQADEVASAPAPDAPVAVPRSLPRRLAEAGPPPLEPSRRPLDALRHRDSAFREMVSTGEERERGPSVVIGRINVEVVPTPTEPRPAAASAPRPLTAESVSVIGPLGGNDRPGLRLGLRHR
jgi:hypothetical protein